MTSHPTRPATVEPLEGRRLASATPHLLRIGTLGDSYSDEYHFYRPDRSHAQNWVEQLTHNRGASFGPYTTHTRGAPRNQGYANDWAQSGATSADLPAQTAGLAAQAAAGQVDVATLLIGGNDFLDLLASEAADPSAAASAPAASAAVAQGVVANIEASVDTILAASPTVRVVISTLPAVSHLPAIASAQALAGSIGLGQPAVVLAATDAAEAQVNTTLAAFAAGNVRLAIADFAATAAAFAGPTYTLGRTRLDALTPGDTPRHLFLADGIHPGTVAQGLLANTFIQAIDNGFGQKIKLLTNRQVLLDARLVT